MEAAASLTKGFKASVEVVGLEQVPFERVLGEKVGGALKALHESNGVKFHSKRQVSHFEGDSKGVRAVVLDDGTRIEYLSSFSLSRNYKS